MCSLNYDAMDVSVWIKTSNGNLFMAKQINKIHHFAMQSREILFFLWNLSIECLIFISAFFVVGVANKRKIRPYSVNIIEVHRKEAKKPPCIREKNYSRKFHFGAFFIRRMKKKTELKEKPATEQSSAHTGKNPKQVEECSWKEDSRGKSNFSFHIQFL